MAEYNPSEMQVASLAKVLLQAKHVGQIIRYFSPSEFLCQAINQPSLEQLQVAFCELATCGAIVSQTGQPVSEKAQITLVGKFALSLPLGIEIGLVWYPLWHSM